MFFTFAYPILFSVFLALSKIKFKKFVNFSSIFTFLWCLFGFLSTFGFYNLRVPVNNVHIAAICFISVFNVAYLCIAKKSCSWSVSYNSRFIKRVNLLQGITMVLLMYLFIKMVTIFITTHNLTMVRDTFFGKDNFSSEYLDILFRIAPISMMEGLIIIYLYCFYQTKKIRYLLMSVLDTGIVTIVNGGRYAILLLIYCIFAIVIISRNLVKSKTDIKNRKIILIALILSLAFMLFVTVSRGQNIIRTFVVYFSGSFSFLDYIFADPVSFGLNEPLYGYLTFGSFFEPFVLFLKALGLTDAKVPQWYFNVYCQQFYNITASGTKIYINNNTTILYYFIRDFGTFGPVLGGLLFGGGFAAVQNGSCKNSVFCRLLFMYFCSVVFNTVMTYQMFGTIPFFIILSFVFVTFRISPKENKYVSFNYCARV